MSKQLSRRQFLKVTSTLAGGALLAACAPQVVQQTVVVKETVQVAQTVQPKAESVKLLIMHVHPVYDKFGNDTVDPQFMAKNPNITIERQLIPGWINEYYPKLQAMYAAGQTFDAAQLPHAAILYSLYSKGVLKDLTPLYASDKIDTNQFFKATIDGAKFPTGAIFMYPLLMDNGESVLLYNKNVLKAAGVSEPKAGSEWTWLEYATWAKDLKSKAKNVVPINNDWSSMYPIEPLFEMWGGARFLDDTGRKCLIDQPSQMDCLTFMDASVKDGWNSKPSALGGFFRDLFTAGTIGVISDFWPTYGGIKANKDVKFEVGGVIMPKGPGQNGRNGGIANMHFFGMGGNTTHVQEAWNYIKYYCGLDIAEAAWAQGLPLPIKSAWSGKWIEDPFTKSVLDTLDKIRPPALPWNFRSNEMGDAYGNGISAVIDGKTELKTAVGDMLSTISGILDKPMA